MIPMSFLLSRDEAMSTAEITSTVLKELGYNSCLVGSVACSLWGMKNRTPKVVLMHYPTDSEEAYILHLGRRHRGFGLRSRSRGT